MRSFLLLCLCGIFLDENALSQTIQPDKKVYDINDTIVITFSYGAERNYSAFVFIRPIKNGGSQYSSNAYDQATGRKVIDDHRFPPGEYEVVLEYPQHAPALEKGRVIARSTFTVASIASQTSDLEVELNILDGKRSSRVTSSRPAVEELQKRLDTAERELDRRQKRLATVEADLKSTSGELDAARQKMKVAMRDLAYFLESKLDSEIQKSKKAIENIEDWKRRNGNKDQTGPNPLRAVGQDEWNEMVSMLKSEKEHCEMLTSPVPEITLSLDDAPNNSFDLAGKRLLEAFAELGTLLPKEEQLYEASQNLESEIVKQLSEIQHLKADLEKKNSDLFAKATSSIEQVDISVDGKNVAEAVFNPQAAKANEQFLQLADRFAAEESVLDQTLADKNRAREAFFDEAKAAKDAAEKLSGWGGAIMLNAYSHTASDLIDVGLAARKGGLYGVLGETLSKAGDFAVAYVKSGGEGETWEKMKDVAYEETAVDEAKMEQQVRQGEPNLLNKWPLTIPELEQMAPAAIDWATKWAEDKAKDKAKEKVMDPCSEYMRDLPIKAQFFDIPKRTGFDPTIQAERVRLSKILQELREQEPSALGELKSAKPLSAFKVYAQQQAVKIGLKIGKAAAKKYEEGLWRSYFEHDLRSRALFEVYRGFNEIYVSESERNHALEQEYNQEQQGLRHQQECGISGDFRIQKTNFLSADTDRNVEVVVKARDLEPDKLHVEIQGKAATSAQSNLFRGIVPAGTPEDRLLHVSVKADAP
jgi:hypothetical protein